MITFEVNDMTCGHCVSTISKALKSVDSRIEFTIDLPRRLVVVSSIDADPQALQDAIADAGYSPVRTEAVTAEAAAGAKTCCGAGK